MDHSERSYYLDNVLGNTFDSSTDDIEKTNVNVQLNHLKLGQSIEGSFELPSVLGSTFSDDPKSIHFFSEENRLLNVQSDESLNNSTPVNNVFKKSHRTNLHTDYNFEEAFENSDKSGIVSQTSVTKNNDRFRIKKRKILKEYNYEDAFASSLDESKLKKLITSQP
uniref:Uncharacterized protein n=1 Tax=Clastoptera arizonana TaxID=38151 RepID=A0A1B6CU84_9HEMI